MRKYLHALERSDLTRRNGKVVQYAGLVLEASGPDVFLGELCKVYPQRTDEPVLAEVVGFRGGNVLLMPYGKVHGVFQGSEIVATGQSLGVPVGDELLGRVVDAFCKPLDDKGALRLGTEYPLYREPINPLAREPIREVLETGVRAIDTLLTLGKGQRVGIFAGSGVGKSTLLGMLARNVRCDINVIALIGERGREVRDFIEQSLGPEGMARSVVLVATADQPALVRTHAVHAATAIAEYFRDQGKDVLLTMDSITRFAMAQREIGLAIGEPPTARGYTPSVFSLLPQILERGGRMSRGGSISAIYTVLVEGDDLQEPITDNMRAILDGHIVLSRSLANKGHYPAIDVMHSVSRLMSSVADSEQCALAAQAQSVLARYDAARDLIEVGAYRAGTNAELDSTIALMPGLESFLRQQTEENQTRHQAYRALEQALATPEFRHG